MLAWKADLADDLISEHNIDLFDLIESRVCQDEHLRDNEASPPSFIIIITHIACHKGWGDVAAVYNSSLCTFNLNSTTVDLKVLNLQHLHPSKELWNFVKVGIVYRPPGPYSFLKLNFHMIWPRQNIILVRNFNIHFNIHFDVENNLIYWDQRLQS